MIQSSYYSLGLAAYSRLTHVNHFSYAPTDWKTKYMEVADMLAETRADLDDFQVSSRELEEELERELERTEKAQQELKLKAIKAEQEKDEWKVGLKSHFDTAVVHQRDGILVQVHVIANDAQYDNHIFATRA